MTGRAAALPVQLVKKSLAEFRVRRRESIIICFLPRHVRGRKHFARSERRIVRYQRTTEAQNAAKLSRKSGKATFSTVSTGRAAALPVLRIVMKVRIYVCGTAGKIPPAKICKFSPPPFSREARGHRNSFTLRQILSPVPRADGRGWSTAAGRAVRRHSSERAATGK